MATEAVVLAAGAGLRFGGGKLLAPLGEGVLLDGALKAAFAAPVRAVTVVVGADAGRVAQAARAFDARVRIVTAADHASGMAASLKAGIASLDDDVEAAFVFLGDMPRVPVAVLGALAQAVADGAVAAAPVFQGRRGNPVVLARTLFADIARLTGDMGARKVLDGLGERMALVQASDDGVLFDVDLRGDLPPP